MMKKVIILILLITVFGNGCSKIIEVYPPAPNEDYIDKTNIYHSAYDDDQFQRPIRKPIKIN